MAVSAVVLPDGRALAVTGADDGTVRVWDLVTGRSVGEPLTGHTGWVRAVSAVVLPDGRALAVTGSDDRTVGVWDLATGSAVGVPLHAPGPVEALAAQVVEGELVVVLGGAGVAVVSVRIQV